MKKEGLGRGLDALLGAAKERRLNDVDSWRNNEEIKGLTYLLFPEWAFERKNSPRRGQLTLRN